MQSWSQLSDLQSRWNLLEHSFYQRWNRGELELEELACYAGEYRHAVIALANASQHAAGLAEDQQEKEQLSRHADEEFDHIKLWDRFIDGVGGDISREPLPETRKCADAWTDKDGTLPEHLIALFAIESAQPEISKTKAEGLRKFYEFDTGPATAYFDLHAERDVEHAAEAKSLLLRHVDEKNRERLLAKAEQVLSSNWQLLDGVERVFCGGAKEAASC